MSIPNLSKQASTPDIIPPPSAPPSTETDQELEDWDIYYKLLLSGKMTQFGGEFVVIHQGKIIAHGTDLDELRSSAATQLGIAAHKVVIPFVDNSECITLE